MSRTARLLFILLAVVVVIGVAHTLVGVIDLDRYRPRIERRLSEAMNLPVRLGGEVRLRILPRPELVILDATVANPPGSTEPHLIEIGRLELGLDAWRLLRGRLEITDLALEASRIWIERSAAHEGIRVESLAALAEEPTPSDLPFRIRSLRFDDVRISYRTAPARPPTEVQIEEVSIDEKGTDGPLLLEARGTLDEMPFEASAKLGPLDELLEPTAPYPVSLQGRLLDARFEAEGTVRMPLQLRGADVSASALLPDPAVFYRAAERPLPKIGAVRLRARLLREEDAVSAQDLVAETTEGAPVRARLAGSVKDLGAFAGVDLRLDLQTDAPTVLDALAAERLPGLRSIEASAVIADARGTLGLEGTARIVGPEGGPEVELAGVYPDFTSVEGIDVRASLRARELSALGKALRVERELPALGPVSIAARIRGRSGTLAAEEVVVALGDRKGVWAEAQGRLQDASHLRGLDFEVRFGSADLRQVAALLNRRLGAAGPLAGSLHVSDLDGSLGFDRLAARAGRQGLLDLQLSGSVDDVTDMDDLELRVELEARDLSVLGTIFGVDLPDVAPVRFEGSLREAGDRIHAEGRALLHATRLNGEWSASFGGDERPSVRLRVHSPHLYLDDIGIQPAREPDATGAGTERPDRPGSLRRKVAAGEPIPFEALRAIDADLLIRADRVTGRAGLEISDARVSVLLDEGDLRVRLDEGAYEGGRLQAKARVDARRPQDPEMSLRLVGSGIDISRLLSQFDEEPDAAGTLGAWIDLRTRGRRLQELRSALAGEFVVVVRDGSAASRYGSRFLRSFARVSIPSLLVPEAPRYSCLLADLEIEEGIATVRSLLIQGAAVRVTGEGRIDLGGDAFDLTLSPRTQEPGLVTVAAAVKVSGPLAHPTFTPVKHTVATNLIRGLLSNAMRPANTLLRSFRDGTSTTEEACARGLPRAELDDEDPARAPGSEGPSPR